MANDLDGVTVAILSTDGFEESELVQPKRALEQAGAKVHVLAPPKSDPSRAKSDTAEDELQGFKHHDKGGKVRVDGLIAEAHPEDYDAVHLPGGVINADALRIDKDAQRFVRAFAKGKPLGVICHGPWLLVSAGLVRGRRLTSWPTLEDDIRNAGGEWEDREVLHDDNWVSSRKPDDLPAFNKKLIELLRTVAASRKAEKAA